MSGNESETEGKVKDRDEAAQIISRLSPEALNLARTMALNGSWMGQASWGEEMARLHLNVDEEGRKLTGVRISICMKSLRALGVAGFPPDRPGLGVWLNRDFLHPVFKAWAEEANHQLKQAISRQEQWNQSRYEINYLSYHLLETRENARASIIAAHCALGQWPAIEDYYYRSAIDPSNALMLVELWKYISAEDCKNFSMQFQSALLDIGYQRCLFEMVDPAMLIAFLEPHNLVDSQIHYAELEILRGNFTEASAAANLLSGQPHKVARASGLILESWLAFLKGDDSRSIENFKNALSALLEGTRKKKSYPEGISAPLALLAFFRSGSDDLIAAAETYTKWGRELEQGYGAHLLDWLVELLEMRQLTNEAQLERNCEYILVRWSNDNQGVLDDLFALLVVHWMAPEVLIKRSQELIEHLRALALRARENGYRWIEMEISELVAEISDDKETASKAAANAQSIRDSLSMPTCPLTGVIKPVPLWEKSISVLESLANPAADTRKKADTKKRLLWGINPIYDQDFTLIPFEQTVLKSGKWSVPKRVALKRLSDNYADWAHLTDADRQIAASIQPDNKDYWSRYEELSLEIEEVAPHLVGHSALYYCDRKPDLTRPAQVFELEPSITVLEGKKGELTIQIHPFIPEAGAGEFYFHQKERDQFEYCRISKELATLSATFGTERSKTFPAEAKARLSQVLAQLSGTIRVEGDAAATKGAGTREVASDAKIHLRMVPLGQGLSITAKVLPIGDEGPAFPPGQGNEAVFGHDSEGPVRAIRNLKDEAARLEQTAAHSEILGLYRGEQFGSWILPELEYSLALLLEIKEMPDEIRPMVEWPEGEALTLKALADSQSFSLRLNSKSDWLEASGELQVDENTVLTMQTLMKLMESGRNSRFIRLEDGQYLALTERLRRQLSDISALARHEPGPDDEAFQLPALTAHLLEDFADEAKTQSNAHWKKRLKSLSEVEDLEIEVPTTLQAELRPYQKEGFEWLARLAHWTGGACLADDMGLGKTIQALALLLRRAADGPALIVAPVSVAGNWADETFRFAPTLNVKLFRGPQRSELLEDLGPGDIVIATYGLLQTESDSFSDVEWNTVVIDEAQAIKNRATLRYKAALRLKSKFRLITTGTPIENHLQELHNLFHFIQPGLLGSQKDFQARFAVPIESHQEADARDRLRRLINPFILRRLKRDVLRDLPEKTEITLQVEMSDEETAFYEALRRNSIEAIENNSDEKGAIRILAELMRLRRACCNPALVDRVNAPASSKLKVFQTTLEELLSNNHKVLVFSQFVDHLAILREHLEKEEVAYQYLDGSTSTKKRKSAIDAFQSGDGDVFLISLKAGGFGLNLTAADYVIHMDPWWNPAVEDQASDRAHRIGQTRPVTIYRMVTTGTIEEKIVALHHQKRELADSLLSGTDSAGKLSVDQLKALLMEE